MANRFPVDGAANNGFGQQSLHQWEGRLLYMAGYPAPPDFRAPGGLRLSAAGVPIPPPPQGDARDMEIEVELASMSDEQRGGPRFFPDNYAAWREYFRQRYESELAAYDGPPPPPARNNTAGLCRWWSAPGRTLAAVLAHIEGGNYPIVKLSASISKLQKLQYVRAGTKAPASAPPALSSRLPEFIRRHGLVGVKAIVEELKKLTQLRKLGVSGINRHNINEFFSETSVLVHLESVLVQLDEDSRGCLEKISLPWKNMQSLTLYGLQDMLPPLEMDTLKKLRKLDLEMDTLQSIGMEFLAKLPELRIIHLRVKQLVDGKLHFCAKMKGLELDTFEKVKILEVTCMSSRLHVSFGSKSMKNLELLKIDCSSAAYELTGQNNLLELKEVFLKGTDDEEVKKYVENLLADHPRKPAVKLGLQRSS